MLFSKKPSTHKTYKCARGAENIHEESTSNVLGILRKGYRLTMRNTVKSRDMEMRQCTKQDK